MAGTTAQRPEGSNDDSPSTVLVYWRRGSSGKPAALALDCGGDTELWERTVLYDVRREGSMSRLPAVRRESITPEGQEVWDRVASSRGGVTGPHSVLIRVPALSEHVRALGDYFLAGGVLPQDDAELAILATVREAGARFAWNRHERRARELGTRPEAIEIVRAQGALDALTVRERLLVEIAHAVLRTHMLPEDLFAQGLAKLGEQQLVELVALVGYYNMIGGVLNSFEVPPPDDSPTF
jgi:4-carboxymuconolactone decarboxylase